MSAEEITSTFIPVSIACVEAFRPYFKAFNESRTYPRFYQAVLVMTADKRNIPIYYYGVVDNCLVVLKKQNIIKAHILRAVLPPISLNNDRKLEIEVIEKLRANSMTLKLSDEDLAYYGYDSKDCIIDNHEFEPILSAEEYGSLEGSTKTKRRLRNDVNHLNQLIEENKIGVYQTNSMSLIEFKRCEAVYKGWRLDRDQPAVTSVHKVFREAEPFIKDTHLLTYATNLSEHGRYIFWGISEAIGYNKAVLNSRFRNYQDETLRDPIAILQYLESKHWFTILGPEAMINYGPCLNKDLAKHKVKFKPIHNLQIYNIRAHKPITLEEWHKCCPNRRVI